MIPPNMRGEDVLAHDERVSDALASAMEEARIKHAVALSSIGAYKTEKTGSVAGLTRLEQKLRRIAGLSVICARASYLMENTLAQIGMISRDGQDRGAVARG